MLCWFLLLFCCYTGAIPLSDNLKNLHEEMTTKELKKYFGEITSSQIPEYDITYPEFINERGNAVPWNRERRSAESHSGQYYKISAFGTEFHLNLTINKYLFAPDFHVETRHQNGSKTKSSFTHRNFYHGHVVSYPHSTVALSDQDGLRGIIGISSGKLFFIDPLPSHLSKNHENVKGSRPHLIVRRSLGTDVESVHDDEGQACETTDELETQQYVYQEAKTKFLEVTYVADPYAIERFGVNELPEILLVLGNIDSRMFYDCSFGPQKVVHVINRIILLNNGEFSYPKNASKLEKHAVCTQWAYENNGPDDADPEHSDLTIAFTSHNNGGVAMKGAVCRFDDACAVVSLEHALAAAFIAAHEIFHSFGYGHDGDASNINCPDGDAVMSTILTAGPPAFVWSECAKDYAQHFLQSEASSCLDDKPTHLGPTQPPILRAMLPGEVYDADKQCEMTFGIGWKQCAAMKGSCSSLYCTKDANVCSYFISPPADGTRCGVRHWCIKGECVDDGSPKIDGNWSEWASYSQCSRTCGGGVQHRTRTCDNPSPQNDGMPCIGLDIGHYRICNKQPCTPSLESFRDQQCREISNMVSYIHTDVCALWCRNDSEIYLYGKVKDGTRCTNDITENDVCVNGTCQAVGCDWEYHSGKEKDRCGKCDGDGSLCEPRYMIYNENFEQYGISDPFSIIILKNGSSNIHASEMAATYNYLGVRNMKGEYLINLPSWSTTVYKAGTKISYIHDDNQYKDEILIPGPLNEEIELVLVRNYEINQGVQIKYYEPVENPVKPPEDVFFWKIFPWSECSKKCAGGVRQRKVKCYRKDDMTAVGDGFCNTSIRPNAEDVCNTHGCVPEWFVTTWNPCSKTCGRGSQTKEIICRQMTASSWIIVNNSKCTELPPDEQVLHRYCNEISCPAEYVGLPWSECSTTCDEGSRTRKLECQRINELGVTESFPLESCYGAPQPSVVKRCNYDVPCEKNGTLLKYTYKDCYNDNGDERSFPVMLKNLRPFIDWGHPEYTVEECAALALKSNKTIFALQFYGECLAPDNTISNFAANGISTNHWSGLGGEWTNCVYMIE